MSLRGKLISEEYRNMVWVRDNDGAEYVCYAKDLKSRDRVSENEKQFCLDTSQVLGSNW